MTPEDYCCICGEDGHRQRLEGHGNGWLCYSHYDDWMWYTFENPDCTEVEFMAYAKSGNEKKGTE